mmetsp:Transcript_26127/g.60925  ORF Transcript_26127/g.60925 Transcript_26127/m.60925 type:complete len:205 (+) Transcript_26127:123-737(+)
MAGTSNKIFVGGLPQSCPDDVLSNYFMQYGSIVDCVVMKDRETGNSRGFGFVTFDSTDAVDMVISQYEDHKINDKWVEVKRAIPQNQMPPGAAPPSKGGGGGKGKSRGGSRDDRDGGPPPGGAPPPGAYGDPSSCYGAYGAYGMYGYPGYGAYGYNPYTYPHYAAAYGQYPGYGYGAQREGGGSGGSSREGRDRESSKPGYSPY